MIDLPGHAPGLIGLWRESDRLALVSDCFYTLDMWGRDCPPSVPAETYNYDTDAGAREHPQARRAGARRGVGGAREADHGRCARAALEGGGPSASRCRTT